MKANQVLPETELILIQIAQKYYPHTHFQIIPKFEFEVDNWIEMDFVAYQARICVR